MAIVRDLIIDQYGAFLGKHQGRLVVTVKGEKQAEAPLMHLQRILVTGRGVSLSSDVIFACCSEGIPIHFLDSRGKPYAGLYSAGLTGTVLSRREQLAAYLDERGLTLGRRLAWAKIANQAALLRYMAKYRKEAAPEQYALLQVHTERLLAHHVELEGLQGRCIDDIRERLLSVEGRAAHYYWAALQAIVPEEYGWPGRRGREAQDAINAALNYGYGILYSQVERACILAGLDPYAGYVHADRPGKPSLVYDLIEPYRVPAVDRVVVGLANKRVALRLDDRQRLDEGTRRLLAEHVLARLDKPERHEGKRAPLRVILQDEARHLATFLRGERENYEPFVVAW
ncbi:MAG: CRISPR-associated endonuclease Cas1 [Chloroflexi bacterium]|nr:CRISPR-associated endonuclease Cas1 [Chloroflexota bacterium]